MSAWLGFRTHRPNLRFVAFDVPILAGVDLRPLPWQDRLELLAEAFALPLELSPLVQPQAAFV